MAYPTAQALFLDVTRWLPPQLSRGFDHILGLFNDGLNEVASTVFLKNLQAKAVIQIPSATYTASTISFTESTSTIADSASGFVTAGFEAGQTIKITGASDDDNNQTTEISTVAAGAITVPTALDDESAGESITITADSVDMPSDYQRNLTKVYSLNKSRELKVYDNLEAMLDAYTTSSNTGQPFWVTNPYVSNQAASVAIRGNKLHFQPIPVVNASEDNTEYIQLFYQKLPTAMTLPSSTPSDLPQEIAKALLVNYVLWKLYEGAEKMVGQQSPMTAKYYNLYQAVLAELRTLSHPPARGFRGIRPG